MHSMRKLSVVFLLATWVLAACGGSSTSLRSATSTGTGTGTGTGSTGTTTSTDPVTAVTVISNSAQIAADGSNSATISATAKDANNNLVMGATVTFAASAGGVAVTQATTDANGLATATLTAGSAPSGTVITVTAAVGTVSGKTTVTVGNAQQTITVITSQPQIPSDGTKPATITALVRNAQNQFVSGVAVSFTATSGGLAVTQATTDANGAATATLSAAGDKTNRTITVTASAGSESASVPVAVVGTSLTVTGPSSLVQGSQGTYSLTLTDAGGNGIANQTVTLASAKGNTLSATTLTTNANGQNTFTLSGVNGGTDTVTASALNLKAKVTVAVSTQSFAFSAPTAANATVKLGSTGMVTVAWSAGGVPQTGQVVTFSSTRGTLCAATPCTTAGPQVSSLTATIDGTGHASLYLASSTAGPAVISATGTGVTAQTSIEFVATTSSALVLQASPATIAPQGQSTLTATVRDANNNLVEGQVVNFSITQDPTGGSLSVASATTNVQGQASTVYTASTTTSASNGIVVSADVAGSTASGTADLTVGGQTVFLSLGTGNVVATGPNANTQYSYPYSVQAVDSAGAGVNNVTVTFTVTSLGYGKGSESYDTPPGAWIAHYSTAATDPDVLALPGFHGCLSEDVAGNGILTAAEDYNGNGRLDPGLVVSTDVGSAVTANGGTASVNLIYPKDHAYWVAVKLTASATVSGTQTSTSASFVLPGLSSDYTNQTVSPPGQVSPYGVATTCKVAD